MPSVLTLITSDCRSNGNRMDFPRCLSLFRVSLCVWLKVTYLFRLMSHKYLLGLFITITVCVREAFFISPLSLFVVVVFYWLTVYIFRYLDIIMTIIMASIIIHPSAKNTCICLPISYTKKLPLFLSLPLHK